MRRFPPVAVLLVALFGAACEDDTTGWNKPYDSTSALLCVVPAAARSSTNSSDVDVWLLSCAYLAKGDCGTQATFALFVDEWSQCWPMVDACMAGKDCVVPAGKLAGRPVVDVSTGRTRFNGFTTGGFDGGGNGP